MSRLGRMPSWQRFFVIGGMLACSISGTVYLIGHEFQIQRTMFGNRYILAAHGIFAILASLALGSVLSFHIKAGIQSKKKWLSGFSQLSFLVTLLITGSLLYYGPAQIRDGVVMTHWVSGLIFFAIFLLHAVRKNLSFEPMNSSKTYFLLNHFFKLGQNKLTTRPAITKPAAKIFHKGSDSFKK